LLRQSGLLVRLLELEDERESRENDADRNSRTCFAARSTRRDDRRRDMGRDRAKKSHEDECGTSAQQLKCLIVTDEFTKEGLAIDVDGSIRSTRVIEVP
jgi:hypothetical protein